MTDEATATIERSIEDQLRREGYPEGFPPLPGIPTGRYSRADFRDREMEHMWKTSWLMAGLESDLPEPGAYFLFERLGPSVIVSRGRDGEIRAFHNVCRHRGAALLTEPRGRTPKFVCPYHAWSYSTDGQLVAVPCAQDFDRLDKAQYGLAAIRCERWRGLVFLNFDADAEPLAEFLAPLAKASEGFPLEGLVTQDRFDNPLDCNWKLAAHNFIEAYHVAAVHPKTLAPFLNPETWVATLLDNGHARIAVEKPAGGSIYQPGYGSAPEVDETFRRFTVTLSIFPNTSVTLDPSGFAIQSFWPAGVARSVSEIRLVGWEGEADPAYWTGLRDVVTDILAEDLQLFAGLQRGMDGGSLPQLTLGYRERALYWLDEEIDRRIGADRIPQGLSVAPVLAAHVNR